MVSLGRATFSTLHVETVVMLSRIAIPTGTADYNCVDASRTITCANAPPSAHDIESSACSTLPKVAITNSNMTRVKCILEVAGFRYLNCVSLGVQQKLRMSGRFRVVLTAGCSCLKRHHFFTIINLNYSFAVCSTSCLEGSLYLVQNARDSTQNTSLVFKTTAATKMTPDSKMWIMAVFVVIGSVSAAPTVATEPADVDPNLGRQADAGVTTTSLLSASSTDDLMTNLNNLVQGVCRDQSGVEYR